MKQHRLDGEFAKQGGQGQRQANAHNSQAAVKCQTKRQGCNV
jgi:hypothetical protein